MFVSKTPESNNNTDIDSIGQRRTQTFLRWITLISLVLSLANFVLAIVQTQWTLFLLSGLFAISFVVGFLASTDTWKAPEALKLIASAFVLELALALSAGIFSFAFGLPIAFIAIFVGFLYASFNRSGWLNDFIISLGLAGALIGLALSVLAPFPQISNLVINVALIILAALILFLFVRLYVTGGILFSLRIKLTISALAIALVPLIFLSIINSQNVQNSIKTQSNESLRIASELTVNEIDTYLSTSLTSLQTEASLPAILAYIKLAPESRSGSPEEANLVATLNSLQTKETTYAPSYGLINRLGVNVYDTELTKIGVSELNTDYFQKVADTGSAYVSPVEFVSNSRDAFLYFITPIFDENHVVLGYLRMSVDARVLQSKLLSMAGTIGTHSYPILLDENGLRLADSKDPNLLYHFIRPIDTDTYTNLLKTGRLPSYILPAEIVSVIDEVNTNVFGGKLKPFEFFTVKSLGSNSTTPDTATFAPLTNQTWTVVYLQEQSAVVAAQESLVRSTALIAILISAFLSIVVTFVSRLFTKPILDLTDSAVKVSTGDLTTLTRVTSTDEIGILGNAFNSMTKQLRESIENLEIRVRERTQLLAKQNETLQYRSVQLQTVADVARGLVSTTDFESLLSTITTLISDRFNYYHVGIFLIDEFGEFAVLRASNSVGGQRMLDRQHKLRVGQVGIVGFVTGAGQPRIATDVGKDAVFFNNPDLPETKSEMALPLKIENRVIGALDIQSIESNAFSEADIQLFSTLADQVSIAINNNQLLANTEKALTDAQNLHRQYLDQEWSRRSTDEGLSNYRYTSHGLLQTDEDLPEIRMVLDSNRPVTRSYGTDDKDGEPYSVLAVPILLRGQAIGVIHLRQNGEQDFVWSENELITVQNVADQVGQTLESARLFEQTIRRADRERRVLEITNKIRATNEPQKMLEVTLEELKKHLSASQTQIVINVPGITSTLGSTGSPVGTISPKMDTER
jgi:GAF domain-containing protein/HAMP domain-containing protein